MTDVELALDARAELGECPAWDEASGRLAWVDIDGQAVHFFDPDDSSDERVPVGQPVSAIAPRTGGGFVLAVRDGFALLESARDRPLPLASVDHGGPDMRMNDGACDPHGRFWAGSMSIHKTTAAGALYRLDVDGSVARVLEDVTISNGLGWSNDGRTLYFVDTPTMGVDAFDYESGTGAISNRRRVVTVPDSAGGRPDGLTVDTLGGIWVVIAHGAAVHRYTPEGALDHVVKLPVSLVTSCAFGGPDLADLYITSGRAALPASQLRDQPHAGGIFVCRPGVTGQPAEPYRG